MKAVLMSINPKWCELIASGKKTVEVRKTRPKLETPFKVYIYCTSSNIHECLVQNKSGVKLIYTCNYKTAIPCGGHIANGKVIGEFVCDAVFPMSILYSNPNDRLASREFPFTCLTHKDIMDYLGNGGEGYGWHISDLVIYDKPMELSEFRLPCDHKNDCGTCKRAKYCIDPINSEYRFHNCELENGLQRPPQSWCYVERSNENAE